MIQKLIIQKVLASHQRDLKRIQIWNTIKRAIKTGRRLENCLIFISDLGYCADISWSVPPKVETLFIWGPDIPWEERFAYSFQVTKKGNLRKLSSPDEPITLTKSRVGRFDENQLKKMERVVKNFDKSFGQLFAYIDNCSYREDILEVLRSSFSVQPGVLSD